MTFGKGIVIGAGSGAGGVLIILVVVGFAYYPNGTVDDSSQNQNTPIQKPTIIQSDDSKRREIEQLAQTNPLIKGLITGVIRIYVEDVPSYASDDVSNGINAIISELENTQIEQLEFQRVYNPNDADIYISWIKDYGSHTLGEAIFKSHIKIGLGSANCYGEWSPLDAHTVSLIFVHELGHSMGFGHSNDPNNIMYYQTPTRFSVDYDKSWALDEGQLVDISFCNAGTYSYSIRSNDNSNGFYAYVLPPNTDSTSFLTGSGNYYPSCSGADSYVTFSSTCAVPAGAKLLVYNKDDLLQFNAISVNVQIADIGERITPNLEWDLDAFEYDESFLDEVWGMYH